MGKRCMIPLTLLKARSPSALGIGAASFWSVAEKDIAESPTAIAGTPKKNFRILEF